MAADDDERNNIKRLTELASEACATDDITKLESFHKETESIHHDSLNMTDLAILSAKSSSKTCLDFTLTHGVSLNADLIIAAFSTQDPRLLLPVLLKHGFDPSTTLEFVGSPLIMAARKSKIDLLRDLLAAGARPSALARWGAGYGLLASAAMRGSLETVKYLVEEVGVKVKATGALQAAASVGRIEVVRYLLSRLEIAADVDDMPVQRAFVKGTALGVAVRGGHGQVAWLLLEHGANVDARNTAGKTVREVAMERDSREHNTEMIDVLQAWVNHGKHGDGKQRDPAT